MRPITLVPVVLFLLVFFTGCVHMDYDEMVRREREAHPPVLAPRDAECYETEIEIIVDVEPETTNPLPVPPPVLPTTVPSAPTEPKPAYNAESDWDVKLGINWTHIIIHHSATKSGNAESFGRYHKHKRGWKEGLGYHFVICNGNGGGDGRIQTGPRWKKQIRGAHAGVNYYNAHGIGICLVGNFEKERPTRAQVDELVSLIRWLQKKCDIPSKNVLGHRDIKDTLCPGKYFPMEEVRARILQ